MTPTRRVVILGASNIARGLPTVVNTLRGTLGQPLDVMIANGRGRSYGGANCVLLRTLPGILPCRLWPTLAERAPLPTDALLTDIGNDIAYGHSPERIASWVQTCLRRLATVADRIAITELPLESLRTLDPHRFLLVRSILFPRSRLTFEDALQSAERLNELLKELADRFNGTLFCPSSAWYGPDPIHIRFQHVGEAWRQTLACWQNDAACNSPSLSWRERAALLLACPYERGIAGVRQRKRQPAVRLSDGSDISFF